MWHCHHHDWMLNRVNNFWQCPTNVHYIVPFLTVQQPELNRLLYRDFQPLFFVTNACKWCNDKLFPLFPVSHFYLKFLVHFVTLTCKQSVPYHTTVGEMHVRDSCARSSASYTYFLFCYAYKHSLTWKKHSIWGISCIHVSSYRDVWYICWPPCWHQPSAGTCWNWDADVHILALPV